jgi:hypothetical protein
MRRLKHVFASLSALLFMTQTAHATTYCVNTTLDLLDALNEAGSNGESDVVRIKAGTYSNAFPFLVAAFTYSTSQIHVLKLEGGWAGNGDACSRRLRSPTATVLTGSGSKTVLWLSGAGGSLADIVVEQLTIREGYSNDYGAGLRIGGDAGPGGFNGDLVIDRVYFDNNYSTAGAAGMSVRTNGGVRVSNSVFRSNSCGLNACAGEFYSYSPDYVEVRNTFENNTLVGNVCNDDAGSSCVTGGFLVDGLPNNMPRTSVHNNLFALNDGNDLELANSSHADVLFNNINQMAGVPEGYAGNLNIINPRFVSLLDDNFRLMPDSPMRNAGAAGFPYGDDDFDGAIRVQEDQIDIGAFEFSERIFADGFD